MPKIIAACFAEPWGFRMYFGKVLAGLGNFAILVRQFFAKLGDHVVAILFRKVKGQVIRFLHDAYRIHRIS